MQRPVSKVTGCIQMNKFLGDAKYRDKNFASSIQIEFRRKTIAFCLISFFHTRTCRIDACYTKSLYFCFCTLMQITNKNRLRFAFKLFITQDSIIQPVFATLIKDNGQNGNYLLLTWSSKLILDSLLDCQ